MYRNLFFLTAFIVGVVFSNGCNANEANNENIHPEAIERVKEYAKLFKKRGKGYEQQGLYRVVTLTHEEDGYYQNRRTSDPNKYGRPPLNYENLPEVSGETMTIKTNVGDVNVEYQYCLYDDQYNPFDPNSDPNIFMDWVIERVDKVVSTPNVDMSGFYIGGYYVMQWKIKKPPNCRAIDSFVDWLPNNVGIFMTKYKEDKETVYYVSNPLIFVMLEHEEMGGTYIGNNDVHSYIPSDINDPNIVRIHYDDFYHPLNDITKDTCIEGQCYQHFYYILSCNQ
jgi:hypothetical protein